MTNGVFTGLMDLLYLVTIISTILVVKSGGDGLPYLLFYITALGKLYFNLNRFGIFIYSIEKFKITKKQLDDYFKDNKETIMNLLEEAGLLEWYKELPDGLDTLVGEKGIKLSAGQKQRLNLIRGILIDKDLYFFDEPTSNLDILSEEKITNIIEKYLKDKTYVIVTHRPKIKELCNRHYKFENHMLKEIINL